MPTMIPIGTGRGRSHDDFFNIIELHVHTNTQTLTPTDTRLCCLGGAVVGRQTCDRKVTGLIPGRGTIKSSRSTQPSIPRGR